MWQFGKRRAKERFVLWEMKREKTRREISIGKREIKKKRKKKKSGRQQASSRNN